MSDNFQDQSWAFMHPFDQIMGTEDHMEDLGNSLIGPLPSGSGHEMSLSWNGPTDCLLQLLTDQNQAQQPARSLHPAIIQKTEIASERYFCPHYAGKDDLDRHIKNAHQNVSAYHCHVELCPRSIIGNGFPRKDKLVAHLKSKKHSLSAAQANYEATLYNPKH